MKPKPNLILMLSISLAAIILCSTSVYPQKNEKNSDDNKNPANLLQKARQLMKKQPDESIKYVNKALKISKDKNFKKTEADAYTTLASIYFFKSDYKEASNYYEKELELRQKIGNQEDLALVMYNLGSVYMHWGKERKAIKYYEESLDYAKKHKLRDLMLEVYNNLFNINYDKNKHKKALEYFNEYIKIKDSTFKAKNKQKYAVLNKEIERKESELEKMDSTIEVIDEQLGVTIKERDTLKVETLQKDKEIEQLNFEKAYHEKVIQNQRIIRNSLIVGVALVLIILIVLYRFFVVKKRANNALALKNEEIMQQKEEIEAQRDHISIQNKHITDSIVYAQRIQEAALPDAEMIAKIGLEIFILFKPRDIVSGDFYWTRKVGTKSVVVAADCTGHGVPGAFVSMLGISFLNEIIPKDQIEMSAAEVLDKLRILVKASLKQTGKDSETKDGMDIALCIVDHEKNLLQYAGAHNPLFYIRKNELNIIKATLNPIGIHFREMPFENHTIEMQKGDRYYIFSDGYMDQFGGENGNKFSKKQFKKVLLETSNLPLEQQKEKIANIITEWQGFKHQQIDDMLVMGFQV